MDRNEKPPEIAQWGFDIFGPVAFIVGARQNKRGSDVTRPLEFRKGAILKNSYTIKVINWDKIQSRRKDVTNPTWFKIKHNFFDNPDLLDFTDKQRLLWLYILCICGQVNRNTILLFRKDVYARIRMESATLAKTIAVLRQRNIIIDLEENDVTWTLHRQEESRLEGEKKREERTEVCKVVDSELMKALARIDQIRGRK